MKCYLHPEANAVTFLKVPCAPGGKIHICAVCETDPDIIKKTFEKHRAEHAPRIAIMKGLKNPPCN